MTPAPGEIWLADAGQETRRHVLVVSDPRFHRLAERAVVAPVMDGSSEDRRPWHVGLDRGQVAAGHQLATVPNDRLHERVAVADVEALLLTRRAARFILG